MGRGGRPSNKVSILKWMKLHMLRSPRENALTRAPLTNKCDPLALPLHATRPQLWPFNMPRLGFIPLHLFALAEKTLTNLSEHSCNMLRHTTACRAICHVSLHSVNIYLLGPGFAQRPTSFTDTSSESGSEASVSVRPQPEAPVVWKLKDDYLPLHVVQVPRHAQASDGVEFAVVHQAVVSAASHRHAGHQVPVVQQRHVAPDVSHHHSRLCSTWKRERYEGIMEIKGYPSAW